MRSSPATAVVGDGRATELPAARGDRARRPSSRMCSCAGRTWRRAAGAAARWSAERFRPTQIGCAPALDALLADNAVKYSEEHSAIELRARWSGAARGRRRGRGRGNRHRIAMRSAGSSRASAAPTRRAPARPVASDWGSRSSRRSPLTTRGHCSGAQRTARVGVLVASRRWRPWCRPPRTTYETVAQALQVAVKRSLTCSDRAL